MIGTRIVARPSIGAHFEATVEDEQGEDLIVRSDAGRLRRVRRARCTPVERPRPPTGSIARPFTHAMPEAIIEQPKEERWRSEAYLKHARETGREWGCPGCGVTTGIEASHHGSDGGMGLKASDCFAIGECHPCHMLTHGKHGAFPGLTREQTREVIRERQVRTMAEWIAGRRRG